MTPYLIILIYSLMSGISIFDAVLETLPEAHSFVIWVSQRGFAFVCGVVIFSAAYMILVTFYVVLREAVRKAVEKRKNGN